MDEIEITHTNALRKIASNPKIISLEGISASHIELPFLNTNDEIDFDEFLKKRWTENSIQINLYKYKCPGKKHFHKKIPELAGSMDLALYSKEVDKLWVVEYKCTDNNKSRKRAMQQLDSAAQGLFRNYHVKADHFLFVHDDFQVEEWTNNKWKDFYFS